MSKHSFFKKIFFKEVKKKMNLEQYIPFDEKKFRPHQKEAIIKIIKAIEAGKHTIVLNAPVGLGKSLVAYIIASYFNDKNAWKTYIYTSTKFLQDQYTKDFHDIQTGKGRSNFQCLQHAGLNNCENGRCKKEVNFSCQYGITKAEYPETLTTPIKFKNEEEDHCPYWEQKIQAIKAPKSLLNYTYALTDKAYIKHFPKRQITIYDEGHNIEKEMMGFLELKISKQQIKKDLNYNLQYHTTIPDWINELTTLKEQYTDLANKHKKTNKEKYDKYNSRAQTINATIKNIKQDTNNWVYKTEKFKKYDYIIFKPITINQYTGQLFNQSEYNIIMSGSILKPKTFADELGIQIDEYIEVPSIIPPENRPIKKYYAGSMSRRNIQNNKTQLLQHIQAIANTHPDEKGIIHTFTYAISNMIKEEFHDNPRFIFHDSHNREQIIKKFKQLQGNEILVSAYAWEGVDFPYDEARFQVICKNPFPNIGDKQVQARDKIDYGWLYRQQCLVLSQMYGRTNRAPDDYSITYLLDSDINRVLGKKTLVTDYFLEALEDLNYMKPFKITENAEQLLTQDKRKSYEIERQQEKQILNDIKTENLNSLGLLRREYKKLDSDSYTEIIPIVQRLLKNGALIYTE